MRARLNAHMHPVVAGRRPAINILDRVGLRLIATDDFTGERKAGARRDLVVDDEIFDLLAKLAPAARLLDDADELELPVARRREIESRGKQDRQADVEILALECADCGRKDDPAAESPVGAGAATYPAVISRFDTEGCGRGLTRHLDRCLRLRAEAICKSAPVIKPLADRAARISRDTRSVTQAIEIKIEQRREGSAA